MPFIYNNNNQSDMTTDNMIQEESPENELICVLFSYFQNSREVVNLNPEYSIEVNSVILTLVMIILSKL